MIDCGIIADIPGHCAVATCAKPLPRRRRRWCSDQCSRVYGQNHDWGNARMAARRRDGYKCVRCESKEKIEVNHIIPRRGRGYGTGCQHHQTNLETLCHNCHVRITNEQRKDTRNRQRQKYFEKWSPLCQCKHPFSRHINFDEDTEYHGCRVENCRCRLFINGQVARARL